jgi:hypothetical protein
MPNTSTDTPVECNTTLRPFRIYTVYEYADVIGGDGCMTVCVCVCVCMCVCVGVAAATVQNRAAIFITTLHDLDMSETQRSR